MHPSGAGVTRAPRWASAGIQAWEQQAEPGIEMLLDSRQADRQSIHPGLLKRGVVSNTHVLEDCLWFQVRRGLNFGKEAARQDGQIDAHWGTMVQPISQVNVWIPA